MYLAYSVYIHSAFCYGLEEDVVVVMYVHKLKGFVQSPYNRVLCSNMTTVIFKHFGTSIFMESFA